MGISAYPSVRDKGIKEMMIADANVFFIKKKINREDQDEPELYFSKPGQHHQEIHWSKDHKQDDWPGFFDVQLLCSKESK